MTTKIKSGVIGDNVVGITQLNVSDGTNGQYLQTDGAGTLSFSTVSETTINNNANNRIITGSGTANTLNGESGLTYDGSALAVTGTVTTDGLTTTGDINFGDNDKAIFGAGSDLQIYHDGSNSRIVDTGTGDLSLEGANVRFRSTNGDYYAYFTSNAESSIYYNNSIKLATTATGIDVTGTATMDGLVVNTGSYGAVGAGSGRMYGSSTHGLVIQGSGTTNDFLFLGSDGSDSFKIANNRDISFYEDTGTTAKLFWDASAESLGIGTINGSGKLSIQDTTNINTGSNYANKIAPLVIGDVDSTGHCMLIDGNQIESVANPLYLNNNSSFDTLINVGGGNVGIGTTSPEHALHVNGGTANTVAQFQSTDANAYIEFLDSDAGASGCFIGGAGDDFVVLPNASEKFRVTSSGNVGIGTDSPTDMLHLKSTGDASIRLEADSDNVTETDNAYILFSQDGGLVAGYVGYGSGTNDFVLGNEFAGATSLITNNLTRLSIDAGGAVTIGGSLSKGSGSFKIDHPLPTKTDTHHLIHSFIEGPQADNIYRGKVDLVNGSATVNIDTVAGMTEGTFVALNREVQCFTTNESNWDAVKGSVSGNILTIESQNSESIATISWLVIGERQDQHMYDTDWTDENGKVIVEPLKETENYKWQKQQYQADI
jgi:hypothetical protein